jgi:hypothetical protein
METRFMVGKSDTIESKSPLGDLVVRALEESGRWDARALRSPGFRKMKQIEDMERSQFRANAPFPERSQLLLDRAVVEVGLQRLTFVADVLAAGLTFNLTDPLSVTQLAWNAINKVANAQRSMTPSARTENFMPTLLESRLPIYLTLSGFELDIRTLRESQRIGIPLDTAGIKSSTRAVNENIEDAALNGAQTVDGQELKIAGYNAPGLLNAPNAETQVLTAAAWSTAPVGSTVFAQIQAMIAKLVANKKFGPYRLYTSTSVSAALDTDYNAVNNAQGLTIRNRLLMLQGLEGIRSADLMPDGDAATHVGAKVALVQMTNDVIDMVVGQEPTVIPWTSADGFTFHNLVMAIMIPRVRSDYNGDSGICIGTLQ